MASDNYVKFGETPGKPREPYIKGDCTDDDHVDWCELRTSGFHVKFPDTEKSGDDGSKSTDKQTVDLPRVTLTKRVDWASTQLFEKCCEAGKAKIAKSKEERDVGSIDKVTIEICKAAGPKKFAFMVVEYSGVRITKFAINMSDPEPSETIEFEYDKFEFKFQPTDPYSGLPQGPLVTTAIFEGRKEKEAEAPGGGQTQSATATTTSSANGATTTAAAAVVASTASNGARSVGGLSSTVDAGVSATFPGAMAPNGLGLLPD
jgi:type VI protein secretion system component Hcp